MKYKEEMSNLNDFVIENGVLKKYNGKDSEVTITNSVTEIGEEAFEDCNDNLVICCEVDSYAQRYAIANALKYELIEV